MAYHYTFINGKLTSTPVRPRSFYSTYQSYNPTISSSSYVYSTDQSYGYGAGYVGQGYGTSATYNHPYDYGRRRYISRPGSSDLSYTYTLPSNGYTEASLGSYTSELPSYDVMSQYGQSYDLPRTSDSGYGSYDPRSRSRDLGSRYGVTTGPPGYNLGTSYGTSYDVGVGSYGNSSGSYSNRAGLGDASSRYGSLSNRYSNVDTKHDDAPQAPPSGRRVRPAHERYRLVEEEPLASKPSSDVKADDIRSSGYQRRGRHRVEEKEANKSNIKGSFTLYGEKGNTISDSFELERPVFSSVDDSFEASVSQVGRNVDEKDSSTGNYKFRRKYGSERETGVSDSLEKPTFSYMGGSDVINMEEKSSLPLWRRGLSEEHSRSGDKFSHSGSTTSGRNDLKVAGVPDVVDSESRRNLTWRERKEREKREKEESERRENEERAKREREKTEKSNTRTDHTSQFDRSRRIRSDGSTPFLDTRDAKTGHDHVTVERRAGEKLERPKSIDVETMKKMMLTSESPILRSKYREALRKRDERGDSSSHDSRENSLSKDRKGESGSASEFKDRKPERPKSAIDTLEEKSDVISKLRGRLSSREKHSSVEDMRNSVQRPDHVTSQDKSSDKLSDSKRKILVSSRSRIDNLKDSVKRPNEQPRDTKSHVDNMNDLAKRPSDKDVKRAGDHRQSKDSSDKSKISSISPDNLASKIRSKSPAAKREEEVKSPKLSSKPTAKNERSVRSPVLPSKTGTETEMSSKQAKLRSTTLDSKKLDAKTSRARSKSPVTSKDQEAPKSKYSQRSRTTPLELEKKSSSKEQLTSSKETLSSDTKAQNRKSPLSGARESPKIGRNKSPTVEKESSTRKSYESLDSESREKVPKILVRKTSADDRKGVRKGEQSPSISRKQASPKLKHSKEEESKTSFVNKSETSVDGAMRSQKSSSAKDDSRKTDRTPTEQTDTYDKSRDKNASVSRRVLNSRRAQRHGQEGPSIVKHMSDLLFEKDHESPRRTGDDSVVDERPSPQTVSQGKDEQQKTKKKEKTKTREESLERKTKRGASSERSRKGTSEETPKATSREIGAKFETEATSEKGGKFEFGASFGSSKRKAVLDKSTTSAKETKQFSKEEEDPKNVFLDSTSFRAKGKDEVDNVTSKQDLGKRYQSMMEPTPDQRQTSSSETATDITKTLKPISEQIPKSDETKSSDTAATRKSRIDQHTKETVRSTDESPGMGMFRSEDSSMSRAERIALYKEERRKQLAYIASKLGNLEKEIGEEKEPVLIPSLFHAARESSLEREQGTSLGRSRSLKEKSPEKCMSPVTRSRSLRADMSPKRDLARDAVKEVETQQVETGFRGDVKSIDETGKEVLLTEKIANTRKLFEQRSLEEDEFQKVRRKSSTDSRDHEPRSRVTQRRAMTDTVTSEMAQKAGALQDKESKDIVEKEGKVTGTKSATPLKLEAFTSEEKVKKQPVIKQQLLIENKYMKTEAKETKAQAKPSEPSAESDRQKLRQRYQFGDKTEKPKDSVPYTEKQVPDKSVIEKQVPDKSIAEKQVPDKSVTEKQVPDKPVTEKQVPDKPVTEMQVPDKSVAAKRVPDKSVSAKQVPDKSVAAKQVLEKSVNEKQVPDKSVAAKQVPDTSVAAKQEPDKSVAESKYKPTTKCLEAKEIRRPSEIERMFKSLENLDSPGDKEQTTDVQESQKTDTKESGQNVVKTKQTKEESLSLKTRLPETEVVSQQVSEKPQKRRRQLPSIPAALGGDAKPSVSEEDTSNLSSSSSKVSSEVSSFSPVEHHSMKTKDLEEKVVIATKPRYTPGEAEIHEQNMTKPKIGTSEKVQQGSESVDTISELSKPEAVHVSLPDIVPVIASTERTETDSKQQKEVVKRDEMASEVLQDKSVTQESLKMQSKFELVIGEKSSRTSENKEVSKTIVAHDEIQSVKQIHNKEEEVPICWENLRTSSAPEVSKITGDPNVVPLITKESTKSEVSENVAGKLDSGRSIISEAKPENKSEEFSRNKQLPDVVESKREHLVVRKTRAGESLSDLDKGTRRSPSPASKRNAYSSDEGGKAVKKKFSRHKISKSGLHRSKTITEKELKRPVPERQIGNVIITQSKDVARKILLKSPETNLDDLLLQNVEYLSDIETKEPWTVKSRDGGREEGGEDKERKRRFHPHRREALQRRKSESDSLPGRPSRFPSDEGDVEESERDIEKQQISQNQLVQSSSEKKSKQTSISEQETYTVRESSDVHVADKEVGHSGIQDEQTSARAADLDESSAVDKLSTSATTSVFSSTVEDVFVRKVENEAESGKTTLFEEMKGSDSDSSKGSKGQRSESDRRKRKDKSALRKSSLNMPSEEPEEDVGRRGLTVDNRRVGSRTPSLSSTSSLQDDVTEQTHGVSTNKSARVTTDVQHVLSPSQTSTKSSYSILDSILPSKFSVQSKVSSAISKFSGESKSEKSDAKPEVSPRRIARRNDFSSLLQKFSGSDQSSSENEQGSLTRKRNLHRQEAYTLTSSDESESRKTPERTQSLRVKKSPSPEKGVQRSESFRSEFMRRRYSPEPKDRVPLTEEIEHKVTTGSEIPEVITETEKEMAEPSPELAAILNRRQKVVTAQQAAGEVEEKNKIYSKVVEKEEKVCHAAEVEEVIADSEVASALKSRRHVKDARNYDELEKKQEVAIKNADHNKVEDVIADNEVAKLLKARRQETDSKLPEESKVFPKSGVEKMPDLSSDVAEVSASEKPNVSRSHDKDASSATRMKSSARDFLSIDTSQKVLENVSKNLTSEKPSSTGRNARETNIDSKSKASDNTKDVLKSSTPTAKVRKKVLPEVADDTTKPLHTPARVVKKIIAPAASESDSASEATSSASETKASPDRTIRSRVSPLKDRDDSVQSTTVRRTESQRLREVEKPTGILKRTASVKKSGVIVDAELANILQKRRQKEGDDDDAEDVGVSSVEADIEETRRRELEHSKVKDANEEDGGVARMSIAERIFHMQTKLEETKSCPITPKANTSGVTTPRVRGSLTTGSSFSLDERTDATAHVCGEQLIERLSDIAGKGAEFPPVAEKRALFQRRKRDDWRTRTQPVTLGEIEEADGAEVIRRASTGLFESISKTDDDLGKKTEFPQHLPCPKGRRLRDERRKTLPVTAAELNAIPEGELAAISRLRKTPEEKNYRDSRADSGILSGSSDIENFYDSQDRESHTSIDSLRSLGVDMEVSEDDPVRMSVSAKASLFKQLSEDKTKGDKSKLSASGAKRYIDRKKRERSRTQPVTEDEVKTAAEFADGEGETKNKVEDKTEEIQKEIEERKQAEDDNLADDLSRKSLADKVKLFSALKDAEKEEEKKKKEPPVVRRKNRKLASRFNTQPVTVEEVEKASAYRVSPLAMSLVKPPDPELLKGLPLAAQRELMAQHAEVVMSQPGSRSNSRHGSSVDLAESKKKEEESKDDAKVKEDSEVKGGKDSVGEEVGVVSRSGEEKSRASKDTKVTAGLNVETHEELKRIMLTRSMEREMEQKGILKSSCASETKPDSDSERKGILRSGEAADDVKSTPGILKHDSKDEKGVEPKGILKKEGSFESGKIEPEKSVLKESTFEVIKEPEKGVLKESTFELPKAEPEKGMLKKPAADETHSQEMAGILKNVTEAEVTTRVTEVKDDGQEKEGSPEPQSSADRKSASGCAAAIRRRGRDAKQPERYLTQPAETESKEKSPDTVRKMKYGAVRHKTQPVTPEEKREAEKREEEVPEIGSSLKDRLSQLKKSGEEDWKKRVSRQLDYDSAGSAGSSPEVKRREKKLDLPRPSSIADRLNLLENSQEGWRGRVEEKDAKRFTVAHKLAGQVEESPLVRKLKERTKKESESDSELTSPSTPTRESSKIPLPTTIISGPPVEKKPEEEVKVIKDEEEEKPKEPVKVTIPSMDDEHLQSFFQRSEVKVTATEKVDVSVDDFNELFIIANDMLPGTKKIRPKRKHTARSSNPLKTLSVEIKTEYEEVTSGVAEMELKRMKTAQIAKDAGFAEAALAGLASKENFAKVELRKTNGASTRKSPARLDPYKDLMLIHVKGRRRTQVRLVEPSHKSINSGDCYILVTPDKLINWVGEFSNVIEKAKAADIATFIQQKRDMGCKAGVVETVEEARHHLGTGKKFWAALGGMGTIGSAGPPEEDELYENHIVDTNMVYHLHDNSLVPCKEYWGAVPKYEMLKKDEVFVFDFGSELYVWQGKAVKPDQRKLGVKLARQLWERGYDYSACDVNPVCPLLTEDLGGLPSRATERPPWAIFGKVNQNMETILFREKFADWPDTTRLIRVKSTEDVSGSRTELADLQPYDAKLMLPVNTKPVSLVLEGSNVGRGKEWAEDMEGFIREQDIVTLGVSVWHVLEYDHYKMPDHSYGQFHDCDTYVVRWQYMITNKGLKDLKGTQSRRSAMGRERCAYFFWQGKSSTINEKGASALMTVELDEERGPQIRVAEGKEMPCFLNLFDGRMIIHIGKREDESTNTQGQWRSYCVRSEYESELCLVEVPTSASQLRSHSSLLLLNVNSGLLYVWHGCKSPKHTRELAVKAANKLKEKCPLEVGMKGKTYIIIKELEEGAEVKEFWSFIGRKKEDRSQYHSLLKDPLPYDNTVRLFYMTSVSGTFEVTEILNPSRTPDLISPFPVLQSDLYKVSQPGLFLLDNRHIVYLWHGWLPEEDEHTDNVQTGSAKARFNVDRKCAIDTTMQYCREKNPDHPPVACAVYAGLEPLEFTNLFPHWEVNEMAKAINLREGKIEGEITMLEDILKKVTQARYTFDELTDETLPDGVDRLKLESYLEDEEFEEILEMTKDDFYSLPQWKQNKLKQQVGLF